MLAAQCVVLCCVVLCCVVPRVENSVVWVCVVVVVLGEVDCTAAAVVAAAAVVSMASLYCCQWSLHNLSIFGVGSG